MNVVDTSGWIEYLMDAANADFFEPAIRAADELIVPTIEIFETYRVLLRHKGKDLADESIGALLKGQVIDLDAELATSAATLAHTEKLAMADAIILATARRFDATIYTQDVDLKRFEKVKFREKRKG